MLPSKMPTYCATTPVDLRRSFDGLAAAAREVLAKDPRSGAWDYACEFGNGTQVSSAVPVPTSGF
jgi:hypothetical protein